MHVTVDDLADADKAAEAILEAYHAEKPDFVVFLGDQYDAFAVKNVQVERWWMQFLDRIPCEDVFLLLGNHDRPGDSSQVAHALQAHARQVAVVDKPMGGPLGIALLPFYFKAEDFVAAANSPAVAQATTLLCHQSFIGGKYESGLPIEARHDASAVDPNVLPQRCVISGHIHTPQTIGKVLYPGAPRWRNNVSDANVERSILAVDFENGLPTAMRKYSTERCRRIWKMDLTEGAFDTKTLPGKEGDRYVVDIHGSAAYIEAVKKGITRPGVRIRTFQTDRPGPKLSEAQGVTAAWVKWGGEYQPKHGTPRATLERLARERLSL
jgi:DNA repair exonuclease SbcCD nuclease subunit